MEWAETRDTNQHYTYHMNRHDGRLYDSCSGRPICRDYSKAALRLIRQGNAQNFHRVLPKAHHLLDQVFAPSPMLHALMSLLLPVTWKNHWCYNAFSSCCLLSSSPLRLLLHSPNSSIQTSPAQWTFGTHTELATCFFVSSISASGISCREHRRSPIAAAHPTSILPTTTCASASSNQTGKYLVTDQLDQHYSSRDCSHRLCSGEGNAS
jgi:hypothetical protein